MCFFFGTDAQGRLRLVMTGGKGSKFQNLPFGPRDLGHFWVFEHFFSIFDVGNPALRHRPPGCNSVGLVIAARIQVTLCSTCREMCRWILESNFRESQYDSLWFHPSPRRVFSSLGFVPLFWSPTPNMVFQHFLGPNTNFGLYISNLCFEDGMGHVFPIISRCPTSPNFHTLWGHKNPQPGGLKFHKQKYNADGARVQFG